MHHTRRSREDWHHQVLRSALLFPEPPVIENLNGNLFTKAPWFFPSHHTQTALYYFQNKHNEHSYKDIISHNQKKLMALLLKTSSSVSNDGMFYIYAVRCGCHLPREAVNTLEMWLGKLETKALFDLILVNFNFNTLVWLVSTEISSFTKN